MGDDERLLMRSIREFAEQEVAPVFDEIDRRNIAVIRPLFKKAAELGLFMAEVPEALGGLGLSVLAVTALSEARSYLGGLASTVFAHQGVGTLPLANFGSEAQIDRYLARCMNGDLMAAFALTEPGSGSDAMNIKTAAVLNPSGTHYVVNGAKHWITNAGWADLFILFAKVDGTAFSAFLLERDSPGLTVGDHEKLMGQHGSSVCAMQLDDVAIPVEKPARRGGQGAQGGDVHAQRGPAEDVGELCRHGQEGPGHHDAVCRRAQTVRTSDRRVRADPAQSWPTWRRAPMVRSRSLIA